MQLYVREILPMDMRDGIDLMAQVFVALGVLGGLLVNWGLPQTEWRVMFAVGAVHGVLLGLGEP